MQQGPFAPRALPASPLLRAWPPPSRLQPISRECRLYDCPAPPISRWDEDGFSSCSTCPCHRAAPNHPAGVADCLGQPTACPCCPRPTLEGSASGPFFCRGHHWVHLRCGPVTRSPSRRWLGRSASSASFPPRMRPKLRRFLTFPPVRLTLTEHVCLVWTHYGA